MSLLALLLAMFLERSMTGILHLREPRWLDGYYDWSMRRFGGWPDPWRKLAAVSVVVLPALPVGAASVLLGQHLLGLPQLVFAVIVLFFSFGPRDLKEEVDDYIAALERGDRDAATKSATELLEADAKGRGSGLRSAVEDAVFVQANNRIFGVVFWFMVLGPAGAWLFRVGDLMRRRGAFESSRRSGASAAEPFIGALSGVHGLLAWIPARLTALSYALSGSFEDGVGNWKSAVGEASESILERSEDLLARVGRGSLQPSLAGVSAAELDLATARGTWRIVSRSIWIWLAVIAVLVLIGSVV